MADIELEAQITLKVSRDQARQATQEAAGEAGKQVARRTEAGFLQGLETATGQRLRGILARFGPVGALLAQGGLQEAQRGGGGGAAGAAGVAAAPTVGRFIASVGKAGLIVGAIALTVGAAGLALKSVVTRLLGFGRSLSSASGLIAATFARLDIRMQVLRARIGNRLAPQMDRLADAVADLFEQVGPKLVPAIGALLGAIAAIVDFVASAAPGGGRSARLLALLPGVNLPILALIAATESNTNATKDNTLAQQDFEIPPEQAQVIPDFIRMILRGAPQLAPAPGGRPGFAGGPGGQAGPGGGLLGADGIEAMLKADLEKTRQRLIESEKDSHNF